MPSKRPIFQTQADTIQYEQLDNATLLAKFDELSIENLCDIARLNHNFHDIIVNRFLIGKYQLYNGIVHIGLAVEAGISMYPHSMTTITFGYDKTLWAIRSFGHLFREIRVTIDTTDMEKLAQLIGHLHIFCAQAAQDVELKNKFYGESISFPNATKARIYYVKLADGIGLNSYFPRMESLTLYSQSNWRYLAQHFPYLKSVDIEFLSPMIDTDSNIRELIRLNPQIRNFKAPFGKSLELMHYVNANLPELKALTTRNLHVFYNQVDSNQIIRFKNVKEFMVAVVPDRATWLELNNRLTSLKFDELERLSLVTPYPETINSLTAWIAEHKTIQHLQILVEELNIQQMSGLVQLLPNLCEFSLSWTQKNTLIELKKLMLNGSDNLKKIHVRSRNVTTAEFLAIVPTGWALVKNNLSFMLQVTFVRQH